MKQVSENVQKWRESHHKALESLRAPWCRKTGLQLWRGCVRIENTANHAAVLYCNGEMDGDLYETCKEKAIVGVIRLFGCLPDGFFVNGDPRGYTLKIKPEFAPEGMSKDWGGYGCLAAVIN